MLTRRALLRQLGSGTGTACIANLAAASGCANSGAKTTSQAPTENSETLRARLLELVDTLEKRFPLATALAVRRRRLLLGRDLSEVVFDRRFDSSLVVQAFDGVRWHARATNSVSPAAVADALEGLTESVPPVAAAQRRTRDAKPADYSKHRSATQPARRETTARGALETLFQRTASFKSSRTIYRGALAIDDDVERIFLGGGRNVKQSLSRARAIASFVARAGSGIVAEETAIGGSGTFDLGSLTDAALERASQRTLALVGGEVPHLADADVVIDPMMTGQIARAIAVELLHARSWVSGGSPLAAAVGDQIGDNRITLSDDPTVSGGYGSYEFDDEGAVATRRQLLDGGVVVGPFNDRQSALALGTERTGNGRLFPNGLTSPSFSNLIVEPGENSEQDLVADVKRGYLIESATVVDLNAADQELIIRARRAHEIVGGSLTGRVSGPVILRAEIKAFLLAVRAVSKASARLLDGEFVARAVDAPAILTRAELAG